LEEHLRRGGMGGEGLRLKDGLLVLEAGCGRPFVAGLELRFSGWRHPEKNATPIRQLECEGIDLGGVW